MNNNYCYLLLFVVSLKTRKAIIMNISLTPHFDDFINEVKSGQYHSASEVIREALRLLQQEDAVKKARIEYMQREIQKGIDSGYATEWNMQDFLEKSKKRAGIDPHD